MYNTMTHRAPNTRRGSSPQPCAASRPRFSQHRRAVYSTLYQYDEAGNLKQRIDPNGNKHVYTYDAANRLTETKQYNAQGILQHTSANIWDAAGNLTGWSDTDSVRNQTSSATATYDDANRKTNETVTYPSGNTLSYAYAYSPAGYKTQLTWPDGSRIGYSYSGHGELESVTIPNEGTISVNQFKWTAPATVTLPGGTTQERALDGLLKLEGLKVKTPGQLTVLSLANTYGKVQELKQSNRTDTANGGSTSKTSTYSYDDEVRLTQAATDSGGVFGADTETFTLDAVGNRIAHSPVSGAWTYDANNRLTQRGEGSNATTYAYDEAGNQIKKTEGTKVTQYGYDANNRLIEVKDGSNNLIARYGYDPLGRRMWKEQYRDGQGNTLTTQKRTHYLYADEGLIAEATQDIVLNADNTVTASGTPQIVTQYGPRPNSPFTTGMLFVKTRNSNGTDTVAYYHHDHLQTPQQATDKAGNVVWAASYNAFGQATIVTPDATADRPTITSNLRLPGQYFDEETGLHQNYFRDYDPQIGRYPQSDPIGLKGGLNRYTYVGGNPVSFVDPLGLLVTGTYDRSTGTLTLRDIDTGATISGPFESGGKPFGDPIPNGQYDILARAGRDGFYRLEPVDSHYGDDTDERTGRTHFRLHHPGRTLGCVAAKDEKNWQDIEDFINSTHTDNVTVPSMSRKPWGPKTETLPRFGRITVVH